MKNIQFEVHLALGGAPGPFRRLDGAMGWLGCSPCCCCCCCPNRPAMFIPPCLRGTLSSADSSWPQPLSAPTGSLSVPCLSAARSWCAAASNSSGVMSMASCISREAARTNSGSQYLPRPWSLKTWNKRKKTNKWSKHHKILYRM